LGCNRFAHQVAFSLRFFGDKPDSIDFPPGLQLACGFMPNGGSATKYCASQRSTAKKGHFCLFPADELPFCSDFPRLA